MRTPPSGKSNIVLQWDLASLIDLEIAVAQEKIQDDTELKHRDRAFFIRYCAHGGPHGSRSQAFRAWLEERRKNSMTDVPSHGLEAESCLAWIRSLGLMLTFLLGATWAWGALTLHGAPVNVLTFWFLTIGIPFLLTVLGFYLLLGQRLPRIPQAPLILKKLLAKLLISGVLQTDQLLSHHGGSARELAMPARIGELRARLSARHGLLSSLLANTLHLLGLGMVLGIFTALFAFKNFSNQDYGWQSDAACVNPERVEGFVSLISLPWTCLLGKDTGHPTTTEIQHTRFFRNEGVKGMDHASSINWSSFLVFSSIFWGILPRVLLLVAGRLVSRRQMKLGDFSQHRFDALWRRMEMPDISMEPTASDDPHDLPSPRVEPDKSHPHGAGFLLMPQELPNDLLRQIILLRLQSQYGHAPREFRSLPSLPTPRLALLHKLASLAHGQPVDLLILQESFMPPVREFLVFLMKCRAILGADASLRVILIGMHAQDGTWADPSALDCSIWNNKITAIGDPRISLLPLHPPEIF